MKFKEMSCVIFSVYDFHTQIKLVVGKVGKKNEKKVGKKDFSKNRDKKWQNLQPSICRISMHRCD